MSTDLDDGWQVGQRCVAGRGTNFSDVVDVYGGLNFRLPEPFTFDLYRNEVLEED